MFRLEKARNLSFIAKFFFKNSSSIKTRLVAIIIICTNFDKNLLHSRTMLKIGRPISQMKHFPLRKIKQSGATLMSTEVFTLENANSHNAYEIRELLKV